MGQLKSYEAAFTRGSNKFPEHRDFDHFEKYSKIFSSEGKNFMNKLS